MLAVAAPAWADAPGEAAEVLFHEGRELLEQEKYAPACDRLARSMELDSALGTLLLLAYCHEKQGLTATAYGEYMRAEQWAERSGDAEKTEAARRWATALRPKLVMVQLSIDEPVDGLVVKVAERAIAKSAWGERFPVDPGRHRVSASAPGYLSFESTVVVPPRGDTLTVVVPALERAADSSNAPADQKPGFWQTPTPGYIALGLGAAGIGVGSYFGLRAISKNDDSEEFCDANNRCTPEGLDLRDEAVRDARLSTGLIAVGAVGATVGVVLLWPHWMASAQVDTDRAGLTVSGQF